ncbi:MAG TPA: peptidoglycan-binding protein [Candidatus Cryosericum sp.]|nr:peptidoglycan-binding protein [Candidatus Cryosericum sp.]
MDYHGGPYGTPPYDEDQNAAGSDPYAPRSYRDDSPAYGSNPNPYGQEPTPYGQPGSGYTPDDAGYGGRDYSARRPASGYGDQQDEYAPRSNARYGTSGGYTPQGGAPYGTEDEGYGNAPRSASGSYTTRRTVMPPADDGGYSAPRSATGRTTMPSGGEGYTPRGTTGRTAMPRDDAGYTSRGATGRYGTAGRGSSDEYGMDERDPNDKPRAPKGKKKRSKFGKFMHALGLYLAQLPTKTLVIFGGSFAMILVAVILLAVLLPNTDRTPATVDGQLALSDVTVTPSLAPTNTPAPTEIVTPEPTLPALTEPISKAGTVSDLIPAIQERLVELGYMDKPADGYTTKYGPSTKTAIRLFQMKNFSDYNSWDGIIGNGTYTLLMSKDAKAYYLARGDGDDRTKVITKLVEDVTKLQNRLIELGYLAAGSASGLYGNSTALAVQTFQEYHGLLADGKAGQETLKLIYSPEAMDATTGKANNKSKMSPTPSTSPSAGVATTPAP